MKKPPKVYDGEVPAVSLTEEQIKAAVEEGIEASTEFRKRLRAMQGPPPFSPMQERRIREICESVIKDMSKPKEVPKDCSSCNGIAAFCDCG